MMAELARGSAKTKGLVLLVDDDRRILNFMRLKLMASGYDVITAQTGHGALSMVEPQRPDVIVLDVMLPGKSGLEVLKEMQGINLPAVIVMSACSDYAGDAMSLGALRFMPKPFDPDELVTSIQAAIERRSAGQECAG
jgi:DNA-binding response OmpR family regulator